MFFDVRWLVGRKLLRFAGILVWRHVRRKAARCSSEVPTRNSVFELLRGDQRKAQALGVQKALEKVPAYTAAQAAAVLAFLSEAGTQSRVSVVPTQCLASMGSQVLYGWRRRSWIIASQILRSCENSLSADVCACLRMSADVCGLWNNLSGQMSADVCGLGQSAWKWRAAVSADVRDEGKRLLCMLSHVCGCLRKEKLKNFHFWQMSAALETKTTPKQGVRAGEL